jgi:voltage-gated potassium channel
MREPGAPKGVRRRFFVALGHAVHLTWPVLSTILPIQVALGLLGGFTEGWSVGDAVYFTFVTGLMISYGDIVPRQALARALAIGIGLSGLFLTGLIAGIAVYAMRTALTDDDTRRENSSCIQMRALAAGTSAASGIGISDVPRCDSR